MLPPAELYLQGFINPSDMTTGDHELRHERGKDISCSTATVRDGIHRAREQTGVNVCVLSQVDKDAELVAQWNYCTLSQEVLRRPIVACELGRYGLHAVTMHLFCWF